MIDMKSRKEEANNRAPCNDIYSQTPKRLDQPGMTQGKHSKTEDACSYNTGERKGERF